MDREIAALKRHMRRAYNKAKKGLANGTMKINPKSGNIVSVRKSAAGALAKRNLAIPYSKGQSTQSKRAKGRARRVQQGGYLCGGSPGLYPGAFQQSRRMQVRQAPRIQMKQMKF
jgi:hypothetical protein